MPFFLTAFESYCTTNEVARREAEKCFDTVPPLPQYDFQPGNLASVVLTPFSSIRQFTHLEMSLIRVFLEKRDKPSALRAYQRISNCAEHLQREPFVIGSLVWIATEKVRLDAMERLLESRLLAEDDLQRLATDLTTLVERILVKKNSSYRITPYRLLVLLFVFRFGDKRYGDTAVFKVVRGPSAMFTPKLWKGYYHSSQKA